MYPLGLIFFLLCLPMHACNASRLGFVAEETDNNHACFLAKDVSRLNLKLHDDQPSISKQVETQISIQEKFDGCKCYKANTFELSS
ncbi:hypothetical protein HRI_004283800 [Hibiscus trionum]|uniref:Uncharacterized protein n=1 Tax=Hibiscus trionum TaxID=183268 RepID=A0A9W7MR07_HIBTR|nr:hypothetical protein HRI_004283800 [Hibiscus trionum]